MSTESKAVDPQQRVREVTFTAIPLYLPVGAPGVRAYFEDKEALDQLEAGSGVWLHFLIPDEVIAGNAEAIYSAIQENERYKPVDARNLPCLLIEDSKRGQDVLRIDPTIDRDSLARWMDHVVKVSRTARSAEEIVEALRPKREALDKSPPPKTPMPRTEFRHRALWSAVGAIVAMIVVVAGLAFVDRYVGIARDLRLLIVVLVFLIPAVILGFYLPPIRAEVKGRLLGGMSYRFGGPAAVWAMPVLIYVFLYGSVLNGTFPVTDDELPSSDATLLWRELDEAFWRPRPGNYHAVLRRLIFLEKRIPPELRDMYNEMRANWMMFAGEYRRAQEAWDARLNPRVHKPRRRLPSGTMRNAIEVIIEEADATQIVMINEAHHVAAHRAFTIQLLRPLFDSGYTYLALETLSNDKTIQRHGHPFQTAGYPTYRGGFYTKEPVFGDLVRTALGIGYTLVAYEHFGSYDANMDATESIRRRETGQANNLAGFFGKNPDAKVLVHVGYAHLYEVPVHGNLWMCARLIESIGIDPLTIDQTRFTGASSPEFENDRYLEALSLHEFQRPSVLELDDGSIWSGSETVGAFDISIFHPRTVYRNNRPSWLTMGGHRALHPYLQENPPKPAEGHWFFVQAIAADEDPSRSVPVDQFVIWPGEDVPALMLPRGEYLVRLWDDQGRLVSEQTIAQQ